jgi:hypothetical protein
MRFHDITQQLMQTVFFPLKEPAEDPLIKKKISGTTNFSSISKQLATLLISGVIFCLKRY